MLDIQRKHSRVIKTIQSHSDYISKLEYLAQVGKIHNEQRQLKHNNIYTTIPNCVNSYYNLQILGQYLQLSCYSDSWLISGVLYFYMEIYHQANIQEIFSYHQQLNWIQAAGLTRLLYNPKHFGVYSLGSSILDKIKELY